MNSEPDVRPVLGGDALNQRALLVLRARRGVAADLPVAMHGAHGALRHGCLGQHCQGQGNQRDEGEEKTHEAERYFRGRAVTDHRVGCRLPIEKPHPGSILWFAGRADEIIKIAAHRLGTIEVETALLRHPAAAEAGVTGRLCGRVVHTGTAAGRGLREVLAGGWKLPIETPMPSRKPKVTNALPQR